MIRKVPLMQMWRELFPHKFQGLYDSAEMGIDNTDLPEKTIKMPEAKEEKDVSPEPGIKESNRKTEPAVQPTNGKGETDERKIISDTGGSQRVPDERLLAKTRKRGQPSKKQEKPATVNKADVEKIEQKIAANDTEGMLNIIENKEIDSEIADQMADLKKKCKAGIEIMTHKGLIDETVKQVFTKKLEEYMDKGQLEYLQKMYQELHTMYFERIKKEREK